MKRLLLSLVALCFLTVSPAYALVCGTGGGCFWVGGTGTWDNSTTTHWASTSGGAGSVAVPSATDAVTFDGSSGGGTVTVSATINGSNTIASITLGAFTGTVDFSANNPSISMATFSLTGAGTKTVNLGSGTFTLTAATGSLWDCTTCTNLTLSAGTSTIDINYSSSPSATRTFVGGAKTYNNLSITNTAFNSVKVRITAAATTFANWTFINAGYIELPANQTMTISGAITYNSTSSSTQGLILSDQTSAFPTTLSVGGANNLSWLFMGNITKSGAGSITCTNCLGNNNTGVTITVPAGAGGGRIIGG